MPFVKFTNTTDDQFRGVYTSDGFVMVQPGKEGYGDVADADQAANKEWFKFASAKPADASADIDENERLNPADDMPEVVSEANDIYASMSDDALRDMIEEATGERPHPRTGRDKLLEKARSSEKKAD